MKINISLEPTEPCVPALENIWNGVGVRDGDNIAILREHLEHIPEEIRRLIKEAEQMLSNDFLWDTLNVNLRTMNLVFHNTQSGQSKTIKIDNHKKEWMSG